MNNRLQFTSVLDASLEIEIALKIQAKRDPLTRSFYFLQLLTYYSQYKSYFREAWQMKTRLLLLLLRFRGLGPPGRISLPVATEDRCSAMKGARLLRAGAAACHLGGLLLGACARDLGGR